MEKLGVELDGALHFSEEAILKDKERTDYLDKMGIRVIRFENWKVFEFTDDVLEQIKKELL